LGPKYKVATVVKDMARSKRNIICCYGVNSVPQEHGLERQRLTLEQILARTGFKQKSSKSSFVISSVYWFVQVMSSLLEEKYHLGMLVMHSPSKGLQPVVNYLM